MKNNNATKKVKIKIIVENITCQFCKYSWQPKTSLPVECPKCKRRLKWKKQN
jgi:predicted Zn-ribbon and HTH transcriptional regulator